MATLLSAGFLLEAANAASPSPEPGIPIRSEAVQRACGACHAADAEGRLSRISWRRTTPEGWQETVKRMAVLNGSYLEPDQAREVVRYLASELGLAPEEVKPARFELERRLVEHAYPDADTRVACGACHSVGRAMLQRRSSEEWDLLVAMHRGYYPLVDFQSFRLPGPPRSEPGAAVGRAPVRHPVDKALAHLKAAYPLSTPEWSAWVANRRAPRLSGRWALSGYEPGRGGVYGEVTIAARPGSDDEFVTEARYVLARGGAPVTRSGQAIVYTGFQWRGRSSEGGESLREVMFLERDGRTLSGRWFAGAHDEKGLEVTLTRIGAEPILTSVEPRALRAGRTAQLRLHGANLERGLAAGDLGFGSGVRVARVDGVEGGLEVEVEVAADAAVGEREVSLGGVSSGRTVAVYKTVDGLSIAPQAGLARIGGARFEKRFQQFEARASSFGADGRPDTPDDVDLGPVDVSWSLEEFAATVSDDDARFVGRIDANGLFTPAEDGPNPRRSGSRNNVGDVWVVASLPVTSPLAPAKALRARAHLLVTVPLYIRWDQPEVAP